MILSHRDWNFTNGLLVIQYIVHFRICIHFHWRMPVIWTKFIWLPHSPGIMIKAWPFLSASLYASYFVVYWQFQMHIWTASGRITNQKMRISLSSPDFVLSLKKDKQETLPVITIVDILTNTNTCTVILRRLTVNAALIQPILGWHGEVGH